MKNFPNNCLISKLKSLQTQSIEVSSSQASVMALELCVILKTEFMKVAGITISATAKVMNVIRMVTLTKANSSLAKQMVKEFMPGPMVKFMMASGSLESRKAMGCGEVFMGTPILESGRIAKLMGMVCTTGRMAIGTKVSGNSASNMAKELTYLEMETHTLVSTKMESLTVMGNTDGLMEAYTLENLKMG